jgi:protein TonB
MKKLAYLFLLSLLFAFASQTRVLAQDDKLFEFVSMEQPPTYPGGIEAFYKYLGQNIKYPKAAIKNKIQGIVEVSFTVEKDGTITTVEANKPIDPLLDAEAVRIITLMKKWNPGMQDGKAVRVKYTIPIKFSL